MRRNEEHMADFKFSTLKYERPDFKELELLFEDLVKQVQEAASYEGLKELLKKAERVQNKLMTACTIASIRHTLDTTDTYYEKEDEYINNTIPTVMPKFLAFDAAVMNSPFRDDIEKEYGKQYFAQKELNRKTFCEANIPLMQQEAKLTNEYQKIMARSLPVEVTNGTLEGDIAPGDITFYRLQSTSDNKLRAYVAQGEVLPVATRSFGSIGVFAIHEMGRFYRHVLIEKNYPHHGAVAFGHYGKALFEVFKYIGVPMEDINYNQPASLPYPTENPFA